MLRLVHLYAFLAVSFVDAFYHRAFLERRCLSSDSIQILKAGSIDEHDDTRKGTACLNLVALASFESSTVSGGHQTISIRFDFKKLKDFL